VEGADDHLLFGNPVVDVLERPKEFVLVGSEVDPFVDKDRVVQDHRSFEIPVLQQVQVGQEFPAFRENALDNICFVQRLLRQKGGVAVVVDDDDGVLRIEAANAIVAHLPVNVRFCRVHMPQDNKPDRVHLFLSFSSFYLFTQNIFL
jgi:hypothetical protein